MRKRTLQPCLWCVLCLAGALPAVHAAAQPADIFAVFDIESKGVTSIDEATMGRLNDYMYGRLAPAGFKLTPQSEVRERVGELKRDSHRDCYDQTCQIELGKAVAAHKVLSSKLIKIGDECTLLSQIYDLKTEATEGGAEAKGPCTEDGVAASIDQVVTQLYRVVARLKGVVLATGPSIGGRVEVGQVFDRGADIVNIPTDETGFLTIHSNPSGATIFINGKKVGQTPFQDEYPAGRYVIVAELARRYHPARQEITLTRQGARVTLDLQPAFGAAKITSSPRNAQVWLDGESVGKTNLDISEKPSGTYHVRVELPDYLPSEGELVIEDGKTGSYHANLVANWGKLDVKSIPSGATVYLDDTLMDDKTPLQLDRVKPGVHIVKYHLPGYGERSEKVTVVRGKKAFVSTKLQKMLGQLAVTCSYPDGGFCECDLIIDNKLKGRTPWKGDVLATYHHVEVRCPNGEGSKAVVVEHNSRSDVNVLIYIPPPPKPPPPPPAPRAAAPEPTPSYDEPKSSGTPSYRSRGERTVFFPLTLSITEGLLLYEGAVSRTRVQMGLDLGFRINAIPWFVPGFGFWVMLESPHEGTFRPGIQWYFGDFPMYVRTTMMVTLSSSPAVGFLTGAGIDIPLWRNGIWALEFMLGVWSKFVWPFDVRIGFGHRF